jgi:molecular chaperone GrpE
MAEPVPSLWGRLFGKRAAATTAPPAAGSPAGNSLPGANWREEIAGEQRESAERLGQAAERVRQMLAALLTGYTMSMQRLERALQQSQLETIPAAGQPFDPERMEAVEVVTEPGRTVTDVIEEVRRGYLWRGRVFRFAQVRVARPEPGGNDS